MGLAASQARLLSITQRISDNELRAQLINNQKMRLATESSKVSENYINALNKTNLMFANYDANDNAQNVPLTFNNLTAFNQYNNQYGLTNTAGNILISENEAELYKQSNGNLEEYLRLHNIEYTTSYWDKIAGQLKDCESFYANPNFNNIVDASDGAWAFVGNPDLDITDPNHTANLLKAMYEGTSMTGKVPKYEETIKTKEYTDLASYIDFFAEKQGAIERENAAATPVINRFIKTLISEMNIPSLVSLSNGTISGIETAKTGSTVRAAFDDLLKKYFGPNTADIPNIDKYFDIKNETYANEIKYDNNVYYIEEKLSTNLGNEITTKYNNGYASDAQIVTIPITTTPPTYDTYIQIPGGEQRNGEFVPYWIKVASGNKSQPTKISEINFPIIQQTTTNVYEYNGSSFIQAQYTDDTDPNNVTLKNLTIDASLAFRWTYDSAKENFEFITPYQDDEGNIYYETTHYDLSDTSTVPNAKIITTSAEAEALIEKKVANDIKDMLQTILNDNYKITSVPANDVETPSQPFTDEDKEYLTNSSALSKEVANMITKINDLIFGPQKITSAQNMLYFLNYITSGKLNTTYNGGSLTLPYNEGSSQPTININDIKPSVVDCVDAYILDTLMDVFGEPKYGYLYTDGNDNVIDSSNTDASAEAQWLINLFNKIQDSGYQVLAKGLANSTEWLQFALENGIVVMQQVDSEFAWQGITHTSCSDIIEQTAATETTIAEAEYNKAMRQIEAKDEMFDLELKNIDTEHSSLEAEYESVKKAMTGNIERSFQMYG